MADKPRSIGGLFGRLAAEGRAEHERQEAARRAAEEADAARDAAQADAEAARVKARVDALARAARASADAEPRPAPPPSPAPRRRRRDGPPSPEASLLDEVLTATRGGAGEAAEGETQGEDPGPAPDRLRVTTTWGPPPKANPDEG